MGCEGCGTSSDTSKGCSSGSCGSGGCTSGKLDVFDWLSNMRLPDGQEPFDCVEVRFKNDRKLFFRNTNKLSLYVGDIVAVEAQSGHDVGVITLTGELVRLQMKNKKVKEDSVDVLKVYRKANEKDIDIWQNCRKKEDDVKIRARKIARELGLEMKISDVEYQGDGTKAIFYYTAEGRVDFRELIKRYASSFGIRVEMKQIGYRQEAAKVGGIGSCGRELCCSTWLTDFRSVNTAAARYQQLSINPQKLAGQCGKLKCCLNFELDSYLDALKDFPSMETVIETEKGKAVCMKIDVFRKEMWFSYIEGGLIWHKFTVDQVKEFLQINKKNQKTLPLEDLAKDLVIEKKEYTDVIQENSLERFERKNKRRKKRSNKGSRSNKSEARAKKTEGRSTRPDNRTANDETGKPTPRQKKSGPTSGRKRQNQPNQDANAQKSESVKRPKKPKHNSGKTPEGKSKEFRQRKTNKTNKKNQSNSPNKKDENQ